MAEKDVTRIAVEQAKASIARIKTQFAIRVPYGPRKVKMSKRELQRMVNKQGGTEKLAMADRMGMDKYLEMMTELFA